MTSVGTNITVTDLPADFSSFSTYFDKYISLFDGVVNILGELPSRFRRLSIDLPLHEHSVAGKPATVPTTAVTTILPSQPPRFVSCAHRACTMLGSKKCTQTMPDDEDESVMVHAAKIFAKYIDGNRDGEPDNTAVATALGRPTQPPPSPCSVREPCQRRLLKFQLILTLVIVPASPRGH